MSYAPILQTPTVVIPITFKEAHSGEKATMKIAFKRYSSREEAAAIKEKLLTLMRKDLWLRMPAPEKLDLDDPKRKELTADYLEFMDSYIEPKTDEEKAAFEQIKKDASNAIEQAILDHIVYIEDAILVDNDTGEQIKIKSTQPNKMALCKLKEEEWKAAGFENATQFVASVFLKTFWGPEIVQGFLDSLTNQSSAEEAKRKNS